MTDQMIESPRHPNEVSLLGASGLKVNDEGYALQVEAVHLGSAHLDAFWTQVRRQSRNSRFTEQLLARSHA